MKKRISLLLVLLFLIVAPLGTACANTGYSGSISYDGLMLIVPSSIDLATESAVPWQLTGRIYFNNVLELLDFLWEVRIDSVRIDVYRLPPANSWESATFFCTAYNLACNQSSVKLSESGYCSLPAGSYEFRLNIDYYHAGMSSTSTPVKQTVYVGNSNAPSQPIYGSVNIICQALDGTILHNETRTLPIGDQTIQCQWNFSGYHLATPNAVVVDVDSNYDSTAYFVFRPNSNGSQSSNSQSSSGGSWNNGASSFPQQPQQPQQNYSSGTGYVVRITHYNAVNVRTGPGTGYDYICEVFPGETYPYIGSSNGWNEIVYNGVNTGYVSGNLTTVERASTGGTTRVVYISNERAVNVRTGPGTGYDYICEVFPGQSFPYLGTVNGWHKICYDGVNVGYVSGYITTLQDR